MRIIFFVNDLEVGWGRALFCEERGSGLWFSPFFGSLNMGFCCLAGCYEPVFWHVMLLFGLISMVLGLDC